MGTRTSPELAQELLVGATPGPWKLIGEYDDGEPRPDDSYLIHTPGGEYLGIMHGQDARLTAAAPELAEIVAGMRAEYAVQVSVDGELWRFAHGGTKSTLDPIDPCWWFRTEEEARDFAKFRTRKRVQVRVVRRLVSDVEVVE